MRRRTLAAMSDADRRLTADEVSRLAVHLNGRNDYRGERALAAEVGVSVCTLRRARARRPLRPDTLAKLRARLTERAGEPSGVVLTPAERGKLALLVRAAGERAIARFVAIGPATLASVMAGRRARRATIARIRDGLTRLKSAFRRNMASAGEALQ